MRPNDLHFSSEALRGRRRPQREETRRRPKRSGPRLLQARGRPPQAQPPEGESTRRTTVCLPIHHESPNRELFSHEYSALVSEEKNR
jgi:hypothetical protein